MPLSEIHYLAIDPGEKSTGWCAFREDGSEIEFGRVPSDANGFMDWLESLDPKPSAIIYENYRINPTINHGFSKVLTAQLIGMIKRYAHVNKIPLHEQPNTVLKIGLRFIGFYNVYYDRNGKKKKHVDDQISAFAHGAYWLQSRKIRKNRLDATGQ